MWHDYYENWPYKREKNSKPLTKSIFLLKLRKPSTISSYLCGENNCGKLYLLVFCGELSLEASCRHSVFDKSRKILQDSSRLWKEIQDYPRSWQENQDSKFLVACTNLLFKFVDGSFREFSSFQSFFQSLIQVFDRRLIIAFLLTRLFQVDFHWFQVARQHVQFFLIFCDFADYQKNLTNI